jgi:hypothetical protein
MDKDILLTEIARRREPAHCFIRWQRPDGGYECELLDYFVRARAQQEEVVTFDLLDIEDMWQELLALGISDFSRAVRKGVEVIDWVQTDAHGNQQVRSCCFRAEGLGALYDEVRELQANSRE